MYGSKGFAFSCTLIFLLIKQSVTKTKEEEMRANQQLTPVAIHVDILLPWLMGIIIVVTNDYSECTCGSHWWISTVNHNHRQEEIALPFPVKSPQRCECG